MPHPVVHWEIAGKDGNKQQDFYGKLFDWNIQVDPAMNYGMVDTGGEGIDGGIFQAPPAAPPHLTIYVSVDDLQAYLDKAVGLGGTAMMPPTPISSAGSFAMFHDAEGNLVGLFKGQEGM